MVFFSYVFCKENYPYLVIGDGEFWEIVTILSGGKHPQVLKPKHDLKTKCIITILYVRQQHLYLFPLQSKGHSISVTLEDHKIYVTPHKTSKYISHSSLCILASSCGLQYVRIYHFLLKKISLSDPISTKT